MVRDKNGNAELGQEKHQENVGEEKLLNKMFEFSIQNSQNQAVSGQGLSVGAIHEDSSFLITTLV